MTVLRAAPHFDKQILDSLDTLCRQQVVTEEQVRLPATVSPGTATMSPVSQMALISPEQRRSILEHIVGVYGRHDLRSLLDDVVYETKPMVDAKQRGAFGEPLKMEMVDNECRTPGLDLERLWESWHEADTGQTRPVAEVMDELRTADHAAG